MSTLTYAELTRTLFPRLTGGIQWGLERTARLLAAVDDPHLTYPTIHVGGTNGKGSVAATIARVLHEAGFRTGLYSSPHLCTFRERIQVCNAPLTEPALVAAAERLWGRVLDESPSFFEATTAIAFLALAEAAVDVAVIEVGLGGRLDATNVIEPGVSVLTNVSLDHVQLLGDSLADVAREKAGIIKANVPVVTAEPPGVALDVFRRHAAEVGAPIDTLRAEDVCVEALPHHTELGLDTTTWGKMHLRTPLLGPHQGMNAALAVRAMERLPQALRPSAEAVRAGVGSVIWPGRLQRERFAGRTWVFDVAHNLAGIQALAAALEAIRPPRPVIALVGVLGDKDWRGMVGPLETLCDGVVLTLPPTAPEDRRWDPEAVLRAVPSPHAVAVPDFIQALETVWHGSAGEPAGTVLVTGSFHTVGDAMIALGRPPYGSDVTLPRPSFAA